MPTTALAERFYDPALLKSWRKDTGRTLERVCADMQERGTPISYPWLRHLEQGTAPGKPSLATLGELAAYYGRDLRELIVARAS